MTSSRDIFKGIRDVLQGYMLNPQYAVVYYPESGTIERAGIKVTGTCEIVVDHLPRTGYSNSMYQLDEYGKNLLVLDGDIYPFWESMFLKDKYYNVLFLKEGEIHQAKVAMESSGVGRKYCLMYRDDGKEKSYFPCTAYEDEFVILKE